MEELVVLVTGGNGGLGKATVERFLTFGSKVVICDLPSTSGTKIANSNAENTLFCPIDVTSESEVKSCIELVGSKFGKLDVVVNCAGIARKGNLFDFKTETPLDYNIIKSVFDVNVNGVFNMCRLAVDLMRKNKPDEDGGRGVIINVASVAGIEGPCCYSAYSSSKGAVIGMTLPMARDLSYVGIRVMTIAPGLFKTNMSAPITSEIEGQIVGSHAFPKRQGIPEEFAKLVMAIVDIPMLNGTTIRIDGGSKVPPMYNQTIEK